MEDGTITNSQITSSSNYENFNAWKGRLNGNLCWSSELQVSISAEWFQVDFLSVVTIEAIQIQGFQDNIDEYVKILQVATGNSQDSLYFIRDDNEVVKVSVKHNISPG